MTDVAAGKICPKLCVAISLCLTEIVTAFTILGLCPNSYWQHLPFKTEGVGFKEQGDCQSRHAVSMK